MESRLQGSFTSRIPCQDTSKESEGAMEAVHYSCERSDDVIRLRDSFRVALSRKVSMEINNNRALC